MNAPALLAYNYQMDSNINREQALREQIKSRIALQLTKGVAAMNAVSKAAHKEKRQLYFNYIRDLIGKGVPYHDRVAMMMEEFTLTQRYVKALQKQYREELKATKAEREENGREDYLTQLEFLYRDAMKGGDRDAAIKLMNTIAKVKGYDAPIRIEAKQQIAVHNNLDNWSVDELLQMRQLLEKNKESND